MCPPKAIEPSVFPWNDCQRPITMDFDGLPRSSQYWRASLAAFSVASDPPDTNHTRLRSPGANLATASARASSGSLVNRCDGTNATLRAWAAMASAISWTPWPMEVTADAPPEPSM